MLKKALVAISGGVDSAVAAYIAQKKYNNILTATLTMGKYCIDEKDINDAKAISRFLGLEHFTIDVERDFYEFVVSYFVQSYLDGKTPNPCIECNRYIKFGRLLDFAIEKGAEKLLTGHYASIKKENDRYFLCKSIDKTKDQTYMLWRLTQDQLLYVDFPLANLTKAEIREIAAEKKLLSAHKKDSQDICFIRDNNYIEFIKKTRNITDFQSGNFIDSSGKILGIHNGIANYTIGQRKGLGVTFGEPMFVKSKSANDNSVTLCKSEELYSKIVRISDINLIACDSVELCEKVTAKARYGQKEENATVFQISDNEMVLEFDNAQRAITPGQSLVMYDGDTVIGGGIIQ